MGIPLVFIIAVASLVFASGGKTARAPRYRPGRPYDFQPIWFLGTPERVTTGDTTAVAALEAPVSEGSSGARVLPGPVGGASDSW